MLEIKGLKVNVEGKEILTGVDLHLLQGKTHVLMGKNGSGKSTLSQVIMGNPNYKVAEGTVSFQAGHAAKNKVQKPVSLLDLDTEERALLGIFLSFQHPTEIPGVSVSGFLRMVYNKRHGTGLSPVKFREVLKEKLKILNLNEEFLHRSLNEGFSGGEKKKMEMLQMLVFEPRLAILDEPDSGLDSDALKTVSDSVNYLKGKYGLTVLLITHYARILKYISPDIVLIMQGGKIIRQGGSGLAHEIEENGYKMLDQA